MKATGIVRKIDELGRIVIPKELRKTMQISSGDSVEIFTLEKDKVVLKKYSVLGDFEKIGTFLTKSIFTTTKVPCLLMDRDKVVYASGVSSIKLNNVPISKNLKEMIAGVKNYSISPQTTILHLTDNEKIPTNIALLEVITANGQAVGAFALLDTGVAINDTAACAVGLGASFLGNFISFE